MSNFRIMLLSTAAIGFAGALATPAFAGEVEKSASFGGHVNRLVSIDDDGDSTDLHTSDAGASMSRIRFQGSAKSESLTTKAYIEVRARGANSSSNVGTGGAQTLSMRHSYLSLSNSMGTLVLGGTNPAGDLNGIGTADFSGANWWGVDKDSLNPGGANNFVVTGRTAGGQEDGGLGTTVSPMHTFTSGRGGVIRYDTPDFNGFSGSVGLKGGGDAAEEPSASIGYSADYDGTKVAAGYGYTSRAGNDTTYKNWQSASVAMELASGINASVMYGRKNNKVSGAIDPTLWSFGVGYDMNVVDAGPTSLGLTYQQQDDGLVVNDDLKWYGLNVSQSLGDYGTDVYGGVSRAEYSRTGTNYEDITSGWVGVRVKF